MEKLHQIIARTAKFVSEHGEQSEIVVSVKQGDNPTFGFLMIDHHLHSYFRFLVDHQKLLQPDANPKPKEEKNGGGALSLLRSVYGEDDDGPDDPILKAKEVQTGKCVDSMNEISYTSEQLETSTSSIRGDKASLKMPSGPAKEKSSLSKRKLSISTVCTGSKEAFRKQESESFGSFGMSCNQCCSLKREIQELHSQLLSAMPVSALLAATDLF